MMVMMWMIFLLLSAVTQENTCHRLEVDGLSYASGPVALVFLYAKRLKVVGLLKDSDFCCRFYYISLSCTSYIELLFVTAYYLSNAIPCVFEGFLSQLLYIHNVGMGSFDLHELI